ncbi:MAG: hypothetical protein ACRC8A_01980 [Microcoleaceae cyanobacterium]
MSQPQIIANSPLTTWGQHAIRGFRFTLALILIANITNAAEQR